MENKYIFNNLKKREMARNYISKIKLPGSSTVHYIKDEEAREMISGGVSFIVAWDGESEPVAANIPAGVKVTYNGSQTTGTLAATAAVAGAFYLVRSQTSVETLDVYDEYVPVAAGTGKAWEKIGDTQLDLSSLGALAYKDSASGSIGKGSGDQVLGEATTFTNSSSAVSFSGGATEKVLGKDTTFAVTQPTISVTPTTKKVKATASGTAVGANGTANAITGFGAHSTDTFLKGVSQTTQKLVKTSITPVNGTESVSKVTKTASKLVTTTVPNVTSVGTMTQVAFAMDATDTEQLNISVTNGSAPTLGTAIGVATGAVASNGGGADVVTGVTISDKTVAKAGTAVDVATGAVSASGTGADVVTGVAEGSTGDAITALGTPTTAAALTGVMVTAQPTISLGEGTGTGTMDLMTGASATASGAAVTANADDQVDAVTEVGTATAAAQTITVGTNDKVKVAKFADMSTSVTVQ